MTKKYEHLQRSDELYLEIKDVGDAFHDGLLFYLKQNVDHVLSGNCSGLILN